MGYLTVNSDSVSPILRQNGASANANLNRPGLTRNSSWTQALHESSPPCTHHEPRKNLLPRGRRSLLLTHPTLALNCSCPLGGTSCGRLVRLREPRFTPTRGGGSTLCEVTELEILYDAYMYEVSHTTLEYAKHLPQVRSLRSGGGRPTGLLNRIPGWAHQRGRSTAGWQPELFDSS